MLSPNIVNPILDAILESQNNKHLLMPELFALQYPGDEYFKRMYGFTTNPHFDTLKNPHLTYQLKPNTSAADAV